MDRPAADDSTGANHFLRDVIAREGGSISFERFMYEALYHPRFGYYAKRVGTIGRKGDFSTSATLHGALGNAVAQWARRRRSMFPAWRRWHLIEAGGGSGEMADEILRSLGRWARFRLHYHIVERSEGLRREQSARLAHWPMVQWHETIEEALRTAGGKALIVSNEFVDAFPCLRLEWDAAQTRWREVRVEWREAAREFGETLVPWNDTGRSAHGESAIFSPAFTRTLAAGQRVEWHRAYHRWLEGWTPLWTHGHLLTIDYGGELVDLYQPRQRLGTLRAYHRQIRYTGQEIYARPGRQDMTADVNFTDLQRWGASFGMENLGLCTQADFLAAWLPHAYQVQQASDPVFAFLTDRQGCGGAFKVLEQRR